MFGRLSILILFTLSGACITTASADDTTLVVWGIGEGEGSIGTFAAIDAFERTNPGVRVITSPAGGGQNPQKMLTAVVGGAAPDVINQDRFTVSSWAARKAFIPLDDLLAEQTGADIIHADDFYSACWDETVFEGKSYAIPNETDARAMYYNVAEFRRIGLVDDSGNATPPRHGTISACTACALASRGKQLLPDC